MDVSKECLNSEMIVAKIYMGSEFLIWILYGRCYKSIVRKPNNFPNLQKLIIIALTIPISSTTCERIFGAMRKIKTLLRTSMFRDRFSNVFILYIEKDMSKNINNNDILNIFAYKNIKFFIKIKNKILINFKYTLFSVFF